MIPGSPANALCHSPWLRMTTRALPSKVSSSVNGRPSSGRVPRTVNKLPVTPSAFSPCGSPWPVRKISLAPLPVSLNCS